MNRVSERVSEELRLLTNCHVQIIPSDLPIERPNSQSPQRETTVSKCAVSMSICLKKQSSDQKPLSKIVL